MMDFETKCLLHREERSATYEKLPRKNLPDPVLAARGISHLFKDPSLSKLRIAALREICSGTIMQEIAALPDDSRENPDGALDAALLRLVSAANATTINGDESTAVGRPRI